jgi:hypothetical protein
MHNKGNEGKLVIKGTHSIQCTPLFERKGAEGAGEPPRIRRMHAVVRACAATGN